MLSEKEIFFVIKRAVLRVRVLVVNMLSFFQGFYAETAETNAKVYAASLCSEGERNGSFGHNLGICGFHYTGVGFSRGVCSKEFRYVGNL